MLTAVAVCWWNVTRKNVPS